MAATAEVLVTNAANGTQLDATPIVGRKNVKLTNNGPNPIYVNLFVRAAANGAAPGSKKGNTIAAGASMDFRELDEKTTLYAIADTAAQSTGAATVISEW